MFVKNALDHFTDHPIIASLLIGGLKNLFIQTHMRNSSNIMNDYFQQIFQKIFEKLYDPIIHQTNELQNISDAINDITDHCDASSLSQVLFEFLGPILQELAKTTNPEEMPLPLDNEKKENFQNYLGSLI